MSERAKFGSPHQDVRRGISPDVLAFLMIVGYVFLATVPYKFGWDLQNQQLENELGRASIDWVKAFELYRGERVDKGISTTGQDKTPATTTAENSTLKIDDKRTVPAPKGDFVAIEFTASGAKVIVNIKQVFVDFVDSEYLPEVCESPQIMSVWNWVGISPGGTWDSIARRVEACGQALTTDDPNSSTKKLCKGTRKSSESKVCVVSTRFAEAMTLWERGESSDGGGVLAWILITISSIVHGVPQVICLFIAWFYYRRARALNSLVLGFSDTDRSETLRGNDEDVETTGQSSYSDFCSAESDARKAADRASRFHSEAAREKDFDNSRETRQREIDDEFVKFQTVGDTIVFVGLIGTLYGLIKLFAAIAASSSADPLIAETSQAQMFGALGLAFGTTMFAGITKVFYDPKIEFFRVGALKAIDVAFENERTRLLYGEDSTSDELSSNRLAGLLSIGAKRLKMAGFKLELDERHNMRRHKEGLPKLGGEVWVWMAGIIVLGMLLYEFLWPILIAGNP
ncbi:MotA/TolQ/ExbB proton channel family protein [Parahaliea mediterranea]|uniref:MotA/TolQ/ExbB proton channel family protein n=1 Tax=Parahaliea mediterranea TaxID=651086 RepID=UPI00130091A3|nr:MotA/TolQ/ExbB proton channel family protein [Parahaliea mediterranea]